MELSKEDIKSKAVDAIKIGKEKVDTMDIKDIQLPRF